MSEENKAVVRRYAEELCSGGPLEIADEIIHPNTRNPRGTGMWTDGPESVKKAIAQGRESFPDVRREVLHMAVDGNDVVLHSRYTGTFAGPSAFCPVRAPAGEKVEMAFVATFTVEDGKIVEEPWNCHNMGDLMDPLFKAAARRWVEEVWNEGNLDSLRELASDNYVCHDPFTESAVGTDRAGQEKLLELSRTAFPDLQTSIEDLIVDGNRVVARWRVVGTHQGEFLGVPATGVEATVLGMSIYRFAEGQIAEEWKVWDALGLMRQLGVVAATDERE